MVHFIKKNKFKVGIWNRKKEEALINKSHTDLSKDIERKDETHHKNIKASTLISHQEIKNTSIDFDCAQSPKNENNET